MLDMGFIPDVERIVSLVSRMRQTLLFSATMPSAIRRLADAFLSNPKQITVAPPATPAETVTQGLIVVAHAGHGGLSEKRAALRKLIDREDVRAALIFCNRKRDVGVLHRSLTRHGYDAGLLHGDLAQSQRTDVLDRFRQGELRLLVCSDVAARGLDIEDMSHVFNFDVPTNPEDYVHRIGRTGRAGRSGRAFTIAIPEDGKYIALIEDLIGKAIPRISLEGVAEAELETGVGRRRHPGRGDVQAGRERRRARTERPAAKERTSGGSEQPPARAEPPAAKKRAAAASDRPMARHDRPAAQQERQESAASRAAGSANGNRRPRRPPRPARDSEKPVVGMGDHVPAFMLRDVPFRKKA
jgi:superfamily II DNA/RNA helicase